MQKQYELFHCDRQYFRPIKTKKGRTDFYVLPFFVIYGFEPRFAHFAAGRYFYFLLDIDKFCK